VIKPLLYVKWYDPGIAARNWVKPTREH